METLLRKVRLRRRVSLSRVAREANVDPGNLSRIERGLANASREVAERLAKYYGGEITELQILYPERYGESGVEGRLRAQDQSPPAGPQP